MAAKYSKVERRVWRDEKVRKLSRPAASARELWMYLLTCDSQTAFPGLYVLRLSTVAEDLVWSREDVQTTMGELVEAGLCHFDFETSVVWLPNAVRKRGDEALSRNSAKGWRNAWDEIPAGELSRLAFHAAIAAIRDAADEVDGDAETPIRAFSAKAPSWLEHTPPKGPVEDPPKPPRSTFEAPSKPLRSPFEAPSNQKKHKQKDQESSSSARALAQAALDELDPDGELIPDHPKSASTIVAKRQEALQRARGRDEDLSDLAASIRAAVHVYAARKGPKGPGLFFTLVEQLAIPRELEKVLDQVEPDRVILRDARESSQRLGRAPPRAKTVDSLPPAEMSSMAAITRKAIEDMQPPPFATERVA